MHGLIFFGGGVCINRKKIFVLAIVGCIIVMVAYVNISKYMENKAFARNYPDWAGSSADQDWYAKMSASEPHKEYEGILYWKGSKEEAGRITVKKVVYSRDRASQVTVANEKK